MENNKTAICPCCGSAMVEYEECIERYYLNDVTLFQKVVGICSNCEAGVQWSEIYKLDEIYDVISDDEPD